MEHKHEKYERLIARCKALAPIPTAVAHPCDESSLRGTVEAAEMGILQPILVGPRDKIKAVATKIYGAADISADIKAREQLHQLSEEYSHFPVCIAKTKYSFSADPHLKGAPTDHVLSVREVRPSHGAEFVVAICGNMMTMPGLPRVPAAEHIDLDENGRISGLF